MQKISLVLFLMFILASCVSNRRLVYVQDEHYLKEKATQIVNPKPEYTIHTNDVLSIVVKSSQEQLSAVFNITNVGNNMMNSPGSFYLSGYSVDESGNISLPTVGELKLLGLTLDQASKTVQQAVNKYVIDATVLVKLISFKISVLGEVNNPGYYYIYNSQATIFEGLGMAGDIANLGNRNKIKLIRQTPNGSEVVLLDITDPSIMKSKYYYLLPNDVLYIPPLKAQTARGNISQLAVLTVLFSGISTVLLVINFLKNN